MEDISLSDIEKNRCLITHKGMKPRLYGLDILRFLLAVEILMFHSNMHVGCSYGRIVNLFLRVGAVSMTAFFILSGYVNQYAFGQYDFAKRCVIHNFYLRRCISIMPSYYLTAILFCVFIDHQNIEDWLLLLPTELFGMQSIYTSIATISHYGGTWFISCILICYFIFPLLSQLIGHMDGGVKLVYILILILLLFYIPVVSMRFQAESMYANPFVRCLEYALGMLLASYLEENLNRHKSPPPKKIYILILFFVWISVSIWLILYMKKKAIPSDYMIYSIFFLPIWLMLIIVSSRIRIKNERVQKIIEYMGAISYNIFLVQFFVWPIERWIDSIIIFNNITRIGCVFILSIGMAMLIHISFEKPVQKKLRRMVK